MPLASLPAQDAGRPGLSAARREPLFRREGPLADEPLAPRQAQPRGLPSPGRRPDRREAA